MSGCKGLEDELGALRSEITKLSSRVEKLADVRSLLSRIGRLEQELKYLNSYTNSQHARVQKLEGTQGSLQQAIESLKSRFGGLWNRLFPLEQEIKVTAASAANAATVAAGAMALGGNAFSKAQQSALFAEIAKERADDAFTLGGSALSRSQQAALYAEIAKERADDARSLANGARGVADVAIGKANQARSVGQQAIERAKNALSAANGAASSAGKALSEAAENKAGLKSLLGRVGGLASKVFGILGLISSFVTVIQLAQILSRLGKVENQADRADGNAIKALEQIFGLNQRLSQIYGRLMGEIKTQIEKLNPEFVKLNQRLNQIYGRLMDEISSQIKKAFDELNNRLKENWADHNRIRSEYKQYVTNYFDKLNKLIQENWADHSQIRSEYKQYVSNYFDKLNQSFQQSIKILNNKIEDLKNWVRNLLKNFNPNIAIGTIAAMAAALALARLLPLLPNLIRQNSPKMTCRFNDIAANRAANEAASANRTTTILNTFTQGALYKKVTDGFAGTFLRLGEPIANGGIAGKLLRFTKSQLWDKVMQSLTFLVVLHNAMFLSKSIVTTLGDTLSVGLSVIGVKDEEDNPIDINKVLGTAANDFMADILGETRWTQLKNTIAQYSRTYQAAANAVQTIRSVGDSTLTVAQFTAEQVSKIGNGLKADGVVSWSAYAWMPEIVTPQNAWLARLGNLDEAASAISMVTNEVKSVQDESKELADQLNEFRKQSDAAQKQKERLADAWDDNSISPPIDKKEIGAD